MKRMTVSLDADVYRQLKRCQTEHESISATLRRLLEEEKAPADYLDELFRDYGGKGLLSAEARERLEELQKNPRQSLRPPRVRGPHAA
jgi:predicted CopG family antitoxin